MTFLLDDGFDDCVALRVQLVPRPFQIEIGGVQDEAQDEENKTESPKEQPEVSGWKHFHLKELILH